MGCVRGMDLCIRYPRYIAQASRNGEEQYQAVTGFRLLTANIQA